MRWDDNHRSSDLIDRRGEGPAIGGGGGGLLFNLLFMVVRSRFGWAGVIVLVIGYGALQMFGGAVQRVGGGQAGGDDASAQLAPDDREAKANLKRAQDGKFFEDQ